MIPEAYDPFFTIKIDGKKAPSELADKISKFEFEEVDDKDDMMTILIDDTLLQFVDDPMLDIGGVITFQYGYLNRRSAVKQAKIKDVEGLNEIKVQAYQINSGVVPPPAPSASPAPAKVESTSSAPKTYTVVKGDNLSAISRRFGLPGWKDLYNANRDVIGSNPNLIYPGQVLKIPGQEEEIQTPAEEPAPEVVEEDSPNPLATHSRVWENMTYSEIATSIAEEMGLQADVEVVETRYDYTPQTNEDNLAFLKRLGDRIGYTVKVYGDKLFFRNVDFSSKTQRTLYYYIDGAGEVEKFYPKIKTKDAKSSASSTTTNPTNKTASTTKANNTNSTKLGQYSYVINGITGEEEKVFTPVQGASNNKVSNTTDNVAAGAMKNSESKSGTTKWFEADIDCIGIPEIKAGGLVTIFGVGKKWSGNWYVKTVRHTIDSGGYRTSLECTRNGIGQAAKVSDENEGPINNPTSTESSGSNKTASKNPGKVYIVDGITGEETVGQMP